MDLAKYQELTGITVASTDEAKFKAQIRRTKAMLESLLGYSLTKSKANTNQYEELGKTKSECIYPYPDVDGELNAADEVINAYRLFPYNYNDTFLEVDPFTQLNAVKLVFLKMGEEPSGVTIKTFDVNDVRVQRRNGFAKYIQKDEQSWCFCECPGGSVQLAVDAEWLFDSCLPDELLYIWADMVTYENDENNGLKSETIGPHSWTKFDRKAPFYLTENLRIILKYSGPNGSVNHSIVL